MKKLLFQQLIVKKIVENNKVTSEVGTVKKNCYSFLTALRFLTIIPVGYNSSEDGKYFTQAIYYFPLVGLIVGLSCAIMLLPLRLFLPNIIIVAIALPLLSGMSGFLHFDGLADSFDGLFSSRSKERSLEIMRDSNIGAMGVAGVLFVMLIKFVALYTIPPAYLLQSVLIIPVAGRCATVFAMATQRYARKEGGLGNLFYSDQCKKAGVFSILFFVVSTTYFTTFLYSLLLIGFVIFFVFVFGLFCKNKIGGATGDTLGATCEITEMLTAVVLASLYFAS